MIRRTLGHTFAGCALFAAPLPTAPLATQVPAADPRVQAALTDVSPERLHPSLETLTGMHTHHSRPRSDIQEVR